MEIKGIESLSRSELQHGLNNGGRFVIFHYCISVVILTIRRGSNVYYIQPGKGAARQGAAFSLLTLFLGWWGIPWGPIYSIGSLYTNFSGGKDVTPEIRASLGV